MKRVIAIVVLLSHLFLPFANAAEAAFNEARTGLKRAEEAHDDSSYALSSKEPSETTEKVDKPVRKSYTRRSNFGIIEAQESLRNEGFACFETS